MLVLLILWWYERNLHAVETKRTVFINTVTVFWAEAAPVL